MDRHRLSFQDHEHMKKSNFHASPLTIIALIVFPVSSLYSQSQVPRVDVRIDAQGDANTAPLILSNLQRLQLAVTLDATNIANFEVPSATSVNAANDESVALRVIVTNPQTNSALPVRAMLSGSSIKDGKRVIGLSVQIPEADNVRAAKLAQLVDQKLAAAQSTGGASQEELNRVSQMKTQIVSGLDQLYVRNQAGDFKLKVEYFCSKADKWNGAVSSNELDIQITDDGDGLATFR
jgi:hypothetical protein